MMNAGMTRYPVVAGHEVVGTIAKIGEQVKRLKVGQAVGLGWHAGDAMLAACGEEPHARIYINS